MTWVRIRPAAAGETEGDVFAIVREADDFKVVPRQVGSSVSLLPGSHGQLWGLPPYRRLFSLLLVHTSAPGTQSSLGSRLQRWVESGAAWVDSPASTDTSSEGGDSG